jgi:hypothetical protein
VKPLGESQTSEEPFHPRVHPAVADDTLEERHAEASKPVVDDAPAARHAEASEEAED